MYVAPVSLISRWHGSAWAGSTVTGLGSLLGLFALRSYDLAEFVGWPANRVVNEVKLQQLGLLRYVRHPLYSATILVLVGLTVQQPDWKHLLFGLLAFLYIRVGISFEEKKLVKTFGDAYVKYRQRTPMLIPAIQLQASPKAE